MKRSCYIVYSLRKHLLCFIFSFLLLLPLFTFSQGARLTPKNIKDGLEKLNVEVLGFAETIPRSYSLEEYVPPVAEQEGGTCVGFSTLYYTLSIMYNIEFNYTSYQDKFANAFDPYFLYSIINNYADSSCEEGLIVYEAVNKINSIGAKKRWISPITKCNTNWTSNDLARTKEYTYPLRIDNIYDIPPYEVDVLKQAIYNDMPVTALFELTESFDSGRGSFRGLSEKGLWTPLNNESGTGYHAMTIIGYDDYAYGGAFRVVNSWGDEWGDKGYFWITYDAFEKVCLEAYAYSADFRDNIDDPYDNFRRYSTDSGLYEGEYINGGLNGYGTWYSNENQTYYFGFLKDGSWDGFHIRLSPDSFKYGKMNDGYFNEFGFADEEFVKKEGLLKEYLSLFTSKVLVVEKIRKANSTKQMPNKDR